MKHLTMRIITAFAILVASVMLSLSFALDISPNEGLILQKGQVIELSDDDSNIIYISEKHQYFGSDPGKNQIGIEKAEILSIPGIPGKIGKGYVYLRMKSLTMMEGAKIIARAKNNIEHLIIHVDTSEFAANSAIQMFGTNATNSGYNGSKAPDLTLKVGKSNMKGLQISSIGGNGHNGANGEKGRNAARKQCSGEDGHPAGRGGNGGNGSNGGDAGKVEIYTYTKNISYTAKIKGGIGGRGGRGGHGGEGTHGKECLGGIFRRGSYPRGPNGSDGKPGTNGKNTSVRLLLLE